MLLNEYNQIRQQISVLEKLNFEEILINTFSKDNLESISEDGWKISDLIINYNRVIKQFVSELENPDFIYYTNTFYYLGFNNTFYLNDLLTNTVNIINNFNTEGNNYYKNLRELVIHIKGLITYQVAIGFWEKSEKKLHNINIIESNKTIKELKIAIEQIRKEKADFEQKKTELQAKIDEFNLLYQSKTNEANEILNKRNEASFLRDEISKIRDDAFSKGAETNQINESQKILLEDIRRQKETQETEFKNFVEENIKSKDLEYAAKLASIDIKIKSFKELEETIKEHEKGIQYKLQEITKLAAFSADVSLANSFYSRTEKIKKSVVFWRWAIPITSVITLGWIIVVFLCLTPTEGNVWSKLLINSIKTIPSFILLGFTISQYTKERNLEEEYAFKSAIALSLNAYADQIEYETNEAKIKLIEETIARLYNKPRIQDYKNASSTFFSKGVKKEDIESIVKTVIDSIGNK